MAFLGVLLVLATPFIEIALFIKVGQAIGVLPTIALTIFSTVVGLAIVRAQGFSTLLKMQRSLGQQQVPVEGMIHAMFLALAGLLMAIPGFFTDAIGLCLLIPPVRTVIGRLMISRFRVTVHGHSGFHGFSQDTSTVVEAEYWEEQGGADHQTSLRHLPPSNQPRTED